MATMKSKDVEAIMSVMTEFEKLGEATIPELVHKSGLDMSAVVSSLYSNRSRWVLKTDEQGNFLRRNGWSIRRLC